MGEWEESMVILCSLTFKKSNVPCIPTLASSMNYLESFRCSVVSQDTWHDMQAVLSMARLMTQRFFRSKAALMGH